jgi:2-polyprenyl-3-methyl-5-hydroxy-6-metoxy-1,4-benzoquinol methylase
MTYTNEDHQEFEQAWWGECVHTFGEEAKQISYAHRMGLEVADNGSGHWPLYDLEGKNILDIGGGPVSMLLKTFNGGPHLDVVDPCQYPSWTIDRYKAHGIRYVLSGAEDVEGFIEKSYDECWIYNVLQHVENPVAVLNTAITHSDTVRLFEWIDTPPSLGHPHTLTEDLLNAAFGSAGTVEDLNENGAVGKAYYGVFPVA